MSLTISGVITASGTTLSGSTLVSGSHYVNYTYSYIIPSVSGSYVCANALIPSGIYHRYDDNWFCQGHLLLYMQNIGESIGLSPLDLKDGLIAWHTFNETSNFFDDWSPNNYYACDKGTSRVLAKQGYGRLVSDGPTGYINVPVLPSGLQTYMCSFWFKPTAALTSGNTQSFRIFTDEPFCGDHFTNSIDYKAFSPVKGWYLLNTTTSCQAGSNGTYLRMQGASNTNWFGSTWTASTLYFKISKNTDWDIETKFNMGPLFDGQAVGIIFFDLSSYVNYASILFKNTGGSTVDTDQTVAMTSNSSPSPFTVSATSQWDGNYPAYKAFDHRNDAYGWCSTYTLPHSIMYGFGSSVYSINRYRLRSPNTTITAGFPTEFYLYGNAVSSPSITNESDWIQIDYQVGIARPGNGAFTSWFDIDTPGSYTYYRLKVVSVTSDTYVWIGEIEFASSTFEPGNIDVLIQTGTHSYTALEGITGPSTSADFRLRMLKRGNIIKFKYCNPSENKWYDTIYEVDTSLWGSNMAIGLQSRNAIGTSPVVNFDYLSFEKGKKPPEFGDVEAPGRFVVSYNETSVSGAVGTRDDSRIWLETKRDGVAYGTSQHYWDPDTWYLLQAGVDSSGNYCWWVNSHLEKGITVGSGTGIGTQFLTGSGMTYFDAGNPPTTSGSFILGEVSHWSRWLTAEEILKLTNKVSQVQWLYTTGYHSSDINLSNVIISLSGSVATRIIPKDISFYYYGEYQAPTPNQADVKFEKVSYRIQKDLIIVAHELNPFIVNIARCSSGWLANQMGCFGCMMSTRSSGDSRCQCLVYEELAFYALGEKRADSILHQIPATQTDYSYILLYDTESIQTDFVQATYDFQSPKIYSIDPSPHSRMLDPNLSTLDFSEFKLYTKDYGSIFSYDSNLVWVKRDRQGFHTYSKKDNFSFYEMDMLTTSSGYGWAVINPQNASRIQINKGFCGTVCIDYSQVVASGVKEIVTTSGLDDSLKLVKDLSYHFAPACEVNGTNYLDMITSSGSWSPTVSGKDAPFVYFTMPGSQTDWVVQTKVRMNYAGEYVGQYAGLMISSSDKNEYVQILSSQSGVICRSHLGYYDTPAVYTGGGIRDFTWLRMTRVSGSLSCYWSIDGTSWNNIEIFSGLVSTIPVASSNPGTYPLINADSYLTDSLGTHYPWLVLDTNASGTYWRSNTLNSGYWISVDYGSPRTIYGYRLSSMNKAQFDSRIRSWIGRARFQGSNTGSSWTTLHTLNSPDDPGPGQWFPSADSYCSLSTLGNYRYYRLYFDSTVNYSTGGLAAGIGSLVLLGTSGINFDMDRDLQIGTTVVSDRDWPVNTLVSLVPTMISNTSPSPFVVSADSYTTNYEPYKAFAGGTWWSYADANPTILPTFPAWLKIDLGSNIAVKGFNINQVNTSSFSFQGSFDDSFWDEIYRLDNIGGVNVVDTCNFKIKIDSNTAYRYYRFVFDGVLINTNIRCATVNNLKLYGITNPIINHYPSSTQAIFDYFSVTTSGGLQSIPIGDPWELLLNGNVGALNSQSNSGLTSYSQVDTQTYKLTWTPLVPLTEGDQVYFRVQSQDAPSFKVSYNITPDTMIYIPATDLNANIIDSNYGATASSYVTVDESDYRHKVYSYKAYGDDFTYLNTSTTVMTPALTSNTTPAPYVVTYSSLYSTSYPGYYAFNKNTWDFWHSAAALPAWLAIDLGSSKVVGKYRVAKRSDFHIPYDWYFQGSSNGSTWVTLHTVTSAAYTGIWTQYYYIPSINLAPYRYYRIYVTRTSST